MASDRTSSSDSKTIFLIHVTDVNIEAELYWLLEKMPKMQQDIVSYIEVISKSEIYFLIEWSTVLWVTFHLIWLKLSIELVIKWKPRAINLCPF